MFGGQRHKRYLKEFHKITYTNLLTRGKLNSYLSNIDWKAQEMFFRLVEQMAECEGISEKLKAEKSFEWVRRIKNIQSRAREIVNAELIYA